MQMISADDICSVLDWHGVLDAMRSAHRGPRPKGESYFIGDASFGLFSRGVILPGQGAGFKVVSLRPANTAAYPPLPMEDAAFMVVDEDSKRFLALLDGPEITRWKTAADSALASSILSRVDSEMLLVVGAGPVARALTDAHLVVRPAIHEVLLWNRTPSKLEEVCSDLKARGLKVEIAGDLDAAVASADIITSATSATTPLIRGECIRAGTHVDLVGGYRPDMQEADCNVFKGARIYVDYRQNALQSGDLRKPIESQIIAAEEIEGDLFDLCQLDSFSRSADDRTVYKNAGGAHLDLIVSQHVILQLLLDQAIRDDRA